MFHRRTGAHLMRLFIASPVSPALRDRLSLLLSKLRSNLPPNAVNWVAPDNLHLTFRFLGEISVEGAKLIAERLSSACAPFAAIPVQVTGLGAFPSLDRPRVLWAGISESLHLRALHDAISRATREFSGTQIEGQFHPHMTLGRAKELSSETRRNVAQRLKENDPGEIGVWLLREVVLMQSELSPSGPHYSRLLSISLNSDFSRSLSK